MYHSPFSFSASNASTNLLGMGTPMAAAFSSMLRPSFAMKNMITTVRKSGSCIPKAKSKKPAMTTTKSVVTLRTILSPPQKHDLSFP